MKASSSTVSRLIYVISVSVVDPTLLLIGMLYYEFINLFLQSTTDGFILFGFWSI